MAHYRIIACGSSSEDWSIVPMGFAVRRCTRAPSVLCTSREGDCPLRGLECPDIDYFGIGRHGKEKAWSLAVEKVRELNPRGDIAQGRRAPTLQNLSGKPEELPHDL